MPRLLTLYIIRHVLGITAVVALAMLAIQSFITLVTDADETGKNGFGVLQLMQTTLLQMPSGLALLMPIVSMIGALMGLGMLAGQSELTAMRAAGLSNRKIAVATLLAGALLGAIGWLVGDVIAPQGDRLAAAIKSGSNEGAAMVWLRDGDEVLRIRHLVAEDRAEAVEIYSLDSSLKLQKVLAADSAHYVDGGWQLEGVRETHFTAEGRAESSVMPTARWSGTVTPNVLRLYLLEADAISVAGLRRLIDYLDANQLDAGKYRLQFWHKLIEPLTIMAMAVFAVPFAFGSLRDSGAGQRLLLGILLGVGFYVINRVSLSLGQIYGWNALLAAGMPTVAWAAIAAFRIRRAN
ncbi:MAG: LPS export ABC transporter permease LptG [Stagnimonas sp.]|nr:LPS export ABC transporter permease LptG [Stagnimonas sp.]